MGKAQSRLAILIISMTTVNAIILSSLLSGSGIIFISLITFGFVLISEYLLTKQTIESSTSKLMLYNQLGAQTRSIISIIISRFIIVGLIGLLSGIIVGASVVYALHLPLNLMPNLLQSSILLISILTIIGICIGSYAAIIQSFKQSNLYQ
tara:strand:- start:510 stop:962 length:453 start_codon:yes stop_codon:yes gene_type:complete